MNILILGEFSAFAKNLALGINKLGGHNVVVVCDGDGFKSIKQDSNSIVFPIPHNISLFGIQVPKTYKIYGFKNFLKSRKVVKRFNSYFDVVFIINSIFIRDYLELSSPFFSVKDLRFVCKNNAKIFMSACGGDLPFFSFAVSDKRFATVYSKIPNIKFFARKESLAKSVVDGVIPMSYQYAESYRQFGKDFALLPAIQLPFDVDSVPTKDFSNITNKIVIFNGALRATKGTKFIDEALKIIIDKYGDRLIIRNDRLPYDQFINTLHEFDLYIDLCTDYDYGMSAIAAMSAGCVVFSGNEKETKVEFGFNDDIPVIPISPDIDDIVNKISYYIENPKEVSIVGKRSHEYVKMYHDCSVVAGKYIDQFKK